FPPSPLLITFPYTPLFRSFGLGRRGWSTVGLDPGRIVRLCGSFEVALRRRLPLQLRRRSLPGRDPLNDRPVELVDEIQARRYERSEEHTSELQSRENLVCR